MGPHRLCWASRRYGGYMQVFQQPFLNGLEQVCFQVSNCLKTTTRNTKLMCSYNRSPGRYLSVTAMVSQQEFVIYIPKTNSSLIIYHSLRPYWTDKPMLYVYYCKCNHIAVHIAILKVCIPLYLKLYFPNSYILGAG